MNVTRKDLVLIVAIVAGSITALWAGIKFVDDRMQTHTTRPHPGAVSRDEFQTYHEMVMDRLRVIEDLLRKR